VGVLVPIEKISAWQRVNCQSSVTRERSRQATPRKDPKKLTTNRGPSLSVSQPMTKASRPIITTLREAAKAVSALVQWNSVETGTKKTEKVRLMPKAINQTQNPAAATM